jgi:hypothetical protein
MRFIAALFRLVLHFRRLARAEVPFFVFTSFFPPACLLRPSPLNSGGEGGGGINSETGERDRMHEWRGCDLSAVGFEGD